MYVSEVTVANKNKKIISDFLFLDSIMALKKLKADIFSVLSWQASLWYCQNVNLNQYWNKKPQTNLRNLLFTLISFYALDMKLNTNTNYLKENHHSVVTLNDYRTILTVLPLHTSSISHFHSKNFALKDQPFLWFVIDWRMKLFGLTWRLLRALWHICLGTASVTLTVSLE